MIIFCILFFGLILVYIVGKILKKQIISGEGLVFILGTLLLVFTVIGKVRDSFQKFYDSAFEDGYEDGYIDGKQYGYEEGYKEGFRFGYNEGYGEEIY